MGKLIEVATWKDKNAGYRTKRYITINKFNWRRGKFQKRTHRITLWKNVDAWDNVTNTIM